MNRITFGRDGEIRPATVVGVGLALPTISSAIDTLIAIAQRVLLGPGPRPETAPEPAPNNAPGLRVETTVEWAPR